eukprot:4057492-Pyramimonas_sp.AAC.1
MDAWAAPLYQWALLYRDTRVSRRMRCKPPGTPRFEKSTTPSPPGSMLQPRWCYADGSRGPPPQVDLFGVLTWGLSWLCVAMRLPLYASWA